MQLGARNFVPWAGISGGARVQELGYLIFYKYFLFEVLLRIYNQTENRTRNKGWQYLIFARKENVSSVRHRTERVGYDVDFRTIIRRSTS